MTKKKNSDAETLARLKASLDLDVLSPAYSDEKIAASLRARGVDPDALGKRGAELAKSLLRARRLAWQDEARIRLEGSRTRRTRSARDISSLSRAALLEAIEAARNDPRLAAPIGVAFRKRRPEKSTDEELRELLGELEELRSVVEASREDDGDPKSET